MHKWHDILEVNGKLKLVHVVSDWRQCHCVQDALRCVTRVAIKEARSREIADQMARSDRLKVRFLVRCSFHADD